MGNAAKRYGFDTRYEFRELEGCGHSFAECVKVGRMDVRALEFLIGSTIASITRDTGGISQSVHLPVFLA